MTSKNASLVKPKTDTTYGVYVSGAINGNDLNMWYDCLVLRDSIEALQVTYDEALAPRVTVDAAVVLSDTSAALSASFSGSGVEASGFAWAEDLTTTPTRRRRYRNDQSHR